jgi:hypothetical protein
VCLLMRAVAFLRPCGPVGRPFNPEGQFGHHCVASETTVQLSSEAHTRSLCQVSPFINHTITHLPPDVTPSFIQPPPSCSTDTLPYGSQPAGLFSNCSAVATPSECCRLPAAAAAAVMPLLMLPLLFEIIDSSAIFVWSLTCAVCLCHCVMFSFLYTVTSARRTQTIQIIGGRWLRRSCLQEHGDDGWHWNLRSCTAWVHLQRFHPMNAEPATGSRDAVRSIRVLLSRLIPSHLQPTATSSSAAIQSIDLLELQLSCRMLFHLDLRTGAQRKNESCNPSTVSMRFMGPLHRDYQHAGHTAQLGTCERPTTMCRALPGAIIA